MELRASLSASFSSIWMASLAKILENALFIHKRIIYSDENEKRLVSESGFYIWCAEARELWDVALEKGLKRGGRYTIGRREKSGRKCREEGVNEMLGVGRYRWEGNFKAFFNLRDDKGWGDGKIGIHCNPLGSPWLPWSDLTEKAWNQTWHISGYQV